MAEYIEREMVLALKQTPGAYGMDISSEEVKSIPAADVRPVVRGRWINPRHDSEMCSCCGTRFYISALFAVGGNDEPNYCPNCGADMREV